MSSSISYCKTITSTVQCYDAWSQTYDTDGNVLQLLDNQAFDEIAQPLLDCFPRNDTKPICCELGCGTGRNTMKILQSNWSVIAIDLSTSMMAKAQQRLTNIQQSSITWIIHDLNNEDQLPIVDSSVDAIISTLVLEHIVSLERFFQTIFRLLKKNETSWVFITSMHSNMYQAGSQAGFVIDETTGEKLCGISFDHSSEEIIRVAKKMNFILIEYVEKGVNNDEDIQRFGCRAKKWKGLNIHASFLFRIIN